MTLKIENMKINLDCNKHKLKHKYDLQKLTTKKINK